MSVYEVLKDIFEFIFIKIPPFHKWIIKLKKNYWKEYLSRNRGSNNIASGQSTLFSIVESESLVKGY